jgi:hypothetical protein
MANTATYHPERERDEQARTRAVQQARLANAAQGLFNCALRASPREIRGAVCLVCDLPTTFLATDADGVHLGAAAFYHDWVAAVLARRLGVTHTLHALLNVLTTRTLALSIPWSDVLEWRHTTLADGIHYHLLLFHNRAHNWEEWIGFTLLTDGEDAVHNLLLERLQRYGIEPELGQTVP